MAGIITAKQSRLTHAQLTHPQPSHPTSSVTVHPQTFLTSLATILPNSHQPMTFVPHIAPTRRSSSPLPQVPPVTSAHSTAAYYHAALQDGVANPTGLFALPADFGLRPVQPLWPEDIAPTLDAEPAQPQKSVAESESRTVPYISPFRSGPLAARSTNVAQPYYERGSTVTASRTAPVHTFAPRLQSSPFPPPLPLQPPPLPIQQPPPPPQLSPPMEPPPPSLPNRPYEPQFAPGHTYQHSYSYPRPRRHRQSHRRRSRYVDLDRPGAEMEIISRGRWRQSRSARARFGP